MNLINITINIILDFYILLTVNNMRFEMVENDFDEVNLL